MYTRFSDKIKISYFDLIGKSSNFTWEESVQRTIYRLCFGFQNSEVTWNRHGLGGINSIKLYRYSNYFSSEDRKLINTLMRVTT